MDRRDAYAACMDGRNPYAHSLMLHIQQHVHNHPHTVTGPILAAIHTNRGMPAHMSTNVLSRLKTCSKCVLTSAEPMHIRK